MGRIEQKNDMTSSQRGNPVKLNVKTFQRRRMSYILLFVSLFIGFLFVRDFTWVGNKQIHTIMETAATLLSAFVGIVALVHYYSKKNNTLLFIGAGFLGTSFLDGYHAVVTSTFF